MRTVPTLRRLLLCAALVAALAPSAPAPAVPAPASLALFLLGHRIGTETATISSDSDRSVLTAHFEYLDRGTTVALDTTLAFMRDFTPLSFQSHGKSYRYFSVDASVANASGAPNTFTLDGMAPITAQGLLIRYWLSHGRPAGITLEPSGDVVRIREFPRIAGVTYLHGHHVRPYTIEGVIWGVETLLLDVEDRDIVAAATTAGVLLFEAVAADLSEAQARDAAARVRQQALALSPGTQTVMPLQRSRFAVTGARLIDGTGAAPIENAVVLVRDGRIEAAGPSGSLVLPRGVPVVEAKGQTILPGLWDMHAHVGQAEWGPVYLAAGVTTARDMGGEFDAAVALRDSWNAGRTAGPRLLLAGLIDGPGPASFGHVTAANAVEGRQAVARYRDAGFQQIKVYTLLDRPTVAAIIDAAHAAKLTVTGHIPAALNMREAVEMGLDHIAHLTVRDAPGSDAMRDTVAFLKSHGTVIDPTLAWSEMLGRSAQTPLASLQPSLDHVTQPLRRMLESANGGNVTPEQARDRLLRSLAIVKALHDGGIPIVAGTDKGIPGVSVAREIELYVQAGISPMDAIRAATAVPARLMGLAAESGTLARGLRADFIIVDGNPLEHISDIRNVAMVSANGRLYETKPLWAAGGFK
ncbi:MAG: amidohydrolase family protein [Vicinamibacterales bacterium]